MAPAPTIKKRAAHEGAGGSDSGKRERGVRARRGGRGFPTYPGRLARRGSGAEGLGAQPHGGGAVGWAGEDLLGMQRGGSGWIDGWRLFFRFAQRLPLCAGRKALQLGDKLMGENALYGRK